MRQAELNRAVAHTTGETVTEITHRGLVPLDDLAAGDGPPIDWDALEAERYVITYPRRRRAPRVA
jgi:hypothetical protein